MISAAEFQNHLVSIADFTAEPKLAVALSGGADSMALAHLMKGFCKKKKIELHLLTVDHGLRPESRKEAKQVADWVKNWPGSLHKILTWRGEKPKTRIQEAARNARYELMAAYCKKQKIRHLFLAHHADDQVETFLFRLAKGSGLDGLSVMSETQERNGLFLIRPCLKWSHRDLVAVCKKNKIPWVDDPSNDSIKYARVRLRQSRKILEQEGLTSMRIVTLAKRIERTRKALEQISEEAWKQSVLNHGSDRIEFDASLFLSYPKEISLRLLQHALEELNRNKKYPASLQKLEEITDALYGGVFKAATLGSCVIRLKKARNRIEILPE